MGQPKVVFGSPRHVPVSKLSSVQIQLINQLKGYFYINPVLALSLTITIFSFVGVPPLAGFFAKQMVLSAALDKGIILISIVAILTSVIGGIYYLVIIQEMFFSSPEYSTLEESNYIKISDPLSFVISIITLTILLFLFMNKE